MVYADVDMYGLRYWGILSYSESGGWGGSVGLCTQQLSVEDTGGMAHMEEEHVGVVSELEITKASSGVTPGTVYAMMAMVMQYMMSPRTRVVRCTGHWWIGEVGWFEVGEGIVLMPRLHGCPRSGHPGNYQIWRIRRRWSHYLMVPCQ